MEMERVLKMDRWGYPVNTHSDACISCLNSYYHQVISHGRERGLMLEATQHDKDCVLANILAAFSSSDPSRVSLHLQAAKSNLVHATSYEKAVFDAVSCLISEDRDDDVAFEFHAKLLSDYPKDLASLKRAQILCFYMGRPDLSLDLVKKVLVQNKHEDYIYGMLAYPLLELGQMADAEEAARKGYEINKHDCWSQHDICHVLQYECRFREAVEFMEHCSSSWTPCSSFMLTHNWWHVALCYLEGHSSITKVLEIYDDHIWKELDKADAMPAEVYVNALGLLLHLHIRGKLVDIQDRLKVLMDCVSDTANWYMDWHLDVLIIWALAQGGETSKAEDLLNGLKSRISKKSEKMQQSLQKPILLAEAMYEYGRGNNKQAVDLLGSDFDTKDYKNIGASDEQLDVFTNAWYSMLLNSGQATTVIEVLEERIKKREGDPFMWRLLEKAYAMTGKPEAATASEKARTLESAYFP